MCSSVDNISFTEFTFLFTFFSRTGVKRVETPGQVVLLVIKSEE